MSKTNTRWTKASVIAEGKKYTNRTQFQLSSGGAYNKARAEGYLDQACAHMSRKKKVSKLTFERVSKAAKQCNTRAEFFRKCGAEYRKAFRENWIDTVCAHMPVHAGHKWDFESVKLEAARYKHRVDFMRKSQSAYKRAMACGWLDDVCKHMIPKERHGVWTYKEVAREAKKYKYRADFSAGSPSAYKSASRNFWLDLVCTHMKPKHG